MPEITFHSEMVHTDETLNFQKEAKIFYIQCINRITLLIFYTTSCITYAEQLNMKRPFG